MIKKKRKCIILGGSGLLGQSIVKEIKDEFSLNLKYLNSLY